MNDQVRKKEKGKWDVKDRCKDEKYRKEKKGRTQFVSD